MSHMNRRQFVKATAASVSLVVLGGGEDFAQAAPPKAASGPLDIGTLDDYPTDGVFDKLLKAEKVLVIRSGDRLYACSARCSHKGSTLAVKEGRIRCPAHGSIFSVQGKPVSGPAKGSLLRFAISSSDQGRLIVDRSKQFGEKQWDDPAAFVKIA
jgi:nitrite reductase/ring-hydroxylating ferredoxin subunit